MSQEHERIRGLTEKWNDEDTARNEMEQRAKRLFQEEQANQIFSPVEYYFKRLAEVLPRIGASVELDAKWRHLDEKRLHRLAKINSGAHTDPLIIDLAVEGIRIFYRDKSYQLSRGIEALINAISQDVEQFVRR